MSHHAGANGHHGAEELIENVPFDVLRVGQTASLTRTLGASDVELFALVAGHVNRDHGENGGGPHSVGHGVWIGALVSAVLGTKLPGPGTLYLHQTFRYRGPILIGDTITARVTVKEKDPGRNLVQFDCKCLNQDGDLVVTGLAEVIAPATKERRPRMAMPRVEMIRHDGHEELLRKCRGLDPLPTAVVHPCDSSSLRGAIEAAEAGLIRPLLVGPQAKILSVAEQAGIDLAPYRIVDAEHSHAAAAAAVALVRAGEAGALMKGSLHTDELMGAVVRREGGLRTGRRVSHVFVMNVPNFPRALLITDAAINIAPSLQEKMDICQNAIDLAHALGVEQPRVAILSAGETVNPRIASTLEAAALCKMAERGQILGGVVDGPMTVENAISEEAALTQGLKSPVAGKADILLVPDLESGNMVAKQLTFMANADGAGIVLGARVPIILTSRADTVRSRLGSCAVALLFGAGNGRKAAAA